MTSEERYNIPKQPEQTCPLINSAIADIRKAYDETRHHQQTDEPEELHDVIQAVDSALFATDSTLEEVRVNVEAIRAWGQAWKDIAKERISDLETTNERIYELEEALTDISRDVTDIINKALKWEEK